MTNIFTFSYLNTMISKYYVHRWKSEGLIQNIIVVGYRTMDIMFGYKFYIFKTF